MPDENPTRTPGERYDALELQILYLLTNGQPVWSVADVGRELGDDLPSVEDAVYGLRTAGLIHQIADGFVFASRAAFRLIEIVGKVA
jgi:Mn-dependent DtxR family transcriptional regulator